MTSTTQPVTGTAPLSSTAFPATSRYNGVAIVTLTTPDNRTISYLQRRILPAPDSFAFVQWYTVKQGDRMDTVTAKVLGDPLQFWRICDANGAMRPEDLVARAGLRLRITQPQGFPGTPNA